MAASVRVTDFLRSKPVTTASPWEGDLMEGCPFPRCLLRWFPELARLNRNPYFAAFSIRREAFMGPGLVAGMVLRASLVCLVVLIVTKVFRMDADERAMATIPVLVYFALLWYKRPRSLRLAKAPISIGGVSPTRHVAMLRDVMMIPASSQEYIEAELGEAALNWRPYLVFCMGILLMAGGLMIAGAYHMGPLISLLLLPPILMVLFIFGRELLWGLIDARAHTAVMRYSYYLTSRVEWPVRNQIRQVLSALGGFATIVVIYGGFAWLISLLEKLNLDVAFPRFIQNTILVIGTFLGSDLVSGTLWALLFIALWVLPILGILRLKPRERLRQSLVKYAAMLDVLRPLVLQAIEGEKLSVEQHQEYTKLLAEIRRPAGAPPRPRLFQRLRWKRTAATSG